MRAAARTRDHVAADRMVVPLPLRGAAAMPAAALAVHQLRYKLAFGADASHALAAQGHAYLGPLVPWIVLVAALSIGATLGRLAQRWAAAAPADRARGASALRTWLLASAALLAIYAGQELLEGLFAAGHLHGFAAVFGAGGWWAVVAALLVGGALALALRGVRTVARALDRVRPHVRVRARIAASLNVRATPVRLAARVAPLARIGAGRAPPRVAITLP